MKKCISYLIKPLLFNYLRRSGVAEFRLQRLLDDLIFDLFDYRHTSIGQKLWCYKRGFTSDKIIRYGLTQENYQDYLSDIDFYLLKNYVNRRFSRFFDDKLAFYYFAKPFEAYLPEHFFLNHACQICRLDNAYKHDSLISVLEKGTVVAAKPCFGRHGQGFYKFAFDKDGHAFINNSEVTIEEIENKSKSLDGYLFTEFLDHHQAFYSAAPFAPMVFRVATTSTEDDGAGILGIATRFQFDNQSLVVDQPGGVFCGVTIDSGKFFKPMEVGEKEIVYEGKELEAYHLPDTIPFFDEMKTLCLDFASHFLITPHLVFDIIITQSGPKILEVGSHGMVRIMQQYYPYRLDPRAAKIFHFRNP